jgi:hypothetical protein
MEPLYVIGRSGDYYKLLKYDPAIMDNERLSKRKEAEYYGWIHKDLLLLFNNAETEVRNGIRLKSLTAITDCGVILEAQRYFNADSLMLYSGPELDKTRGAVGLNRIVYILKRSENGSRVLIAQKTEVSPDEASEMKTGWVDSRLVAPFGQRLTLHSPLGVIVPPQDTLNGTSQPIISPVSLIPALYAHRADSALVFRTLDASPILDHTLNRVYNVDGGAISHRQNIDWSSELKEINVIFAFTPTEHVARQMPTLSNAVQNLKSVFENQIGGFNYNFAATMGERTIDFESNYLAFSDRLIEAGQQIDSTGTSGFTATLRSGLALAARYPKATNIVVLVGERAMQQDTIPQDMHNELVRCNGRLLSYQVYADNEDDYNNFVLQSLDIIETYAQQYRTLNRRQMVYSDQLREENSFIEGAKNVWALDYPARSMTQGMVVFPEKGRPADPKLLISSIDSLVRQVESANQTLIGSLDRAFAQTGRHYSRFQPKITDYLGISPQTSIAPHIGGAFQTTSPEWVTVTEKATLPVDSIGMSTVGLLLTETELKEIKTWVEELSSMKPDKKGETTSDSRRTIPVRRVRRDLRDVPTDFVANNTDSLTVSDSLSSNRYASTGKIRRHIRKLYLQALRNCVFEGNVSRMTLARAQEHITTMPTISPQTNNVTLKSIKRRRSFSDRDLELFVEYFERHKEIIESKVVRVEDLTTSSGETFFFLPSSAMP